MNGPRLEWVIPTGSQLAKEKYLDPTIADEFSVLFRLSERPEDKQIIFNSNLGVEEGITQLEDAINESIAKKTEFDIKNFAALSQNILKDTIAEMKRVKGEQEMLSFTVALVASVRWLILTKNFPMRSWAIQGLEESCPTLLPVKQRKVC
jgi:hypothetical protein